MATFSGATSFYGLSATATASGTNISGNQTVGVGGSVLTLTGFDTAYSMKAVAATTNNSFTFYPATCLATVSAGTPVLSDADGKDCEGVAISALTKAYGVMLRAGTANTAAVSLHTADSQLGTTFSVGVGEIKQIISTTYLLLDVTKVWTVTLPAANDWIEITVIGV